MQARIQPSPSALIYKAAYSRVAFQPWTSLQILASASILQAGGRSEGRLAAQAVHSPAEVHVHHNNKYSG